MAKTAIHYYPAQTTFSENSGPVDRARVSVKGPTRHKGGVNIIDSYAFSPGYIRYMQAVIGVPPGTSKPASLSIAVILEDVVASTHRPSEDPIRLATRGLVFLPRFHMGDGVERHVSPAQTTVWMATA